jgi:hypothetical protein
MTDAIENGIRQRLNASQTPMAQIQIWICDRPTEFGRSALPYRQGKNVSGEKWGGVGKGQVKQPYCASGGYQGAPVQRIRPFVQSLMAPAL